jgi:protein-tyrosine kinase
MSTFFKALEQAERDRATLRREHEPPPPVTEAPASVLVAEPPVVEEAPPPEPEVAPAAVVAPSRPVPRPRIEMTDLGPDVTVGEIDEHLVSLLQPTSVAAERYRVVRHCIEERRRTTGAQVFAVSSPTARDGKTTTVINLAGAIAQSADARVLIVETDLRQPSIAERFGLGKAPFRGLVDAILNPSLQLSDVVRRPPPYNLSLLLAGQPPATPYEVLESPRLGELLAEARRRYDVILLDTPPMVSVPDCRVIGKWVDGFIVVVAAHRTPRKLLEEALDLMEPSKVIGLVLSHDDRSFVNGGSYAPRSTRRMDGKAR